MLYGWQKTAFKKIRDKNAIVSAPTGAGKTKVAYLWAGIIDDKEQIIYPGILKCGKIIFTAPIKALSNERYLELKNMGLNVGLETGDFKKNLDADIICCTQEIYTKKYAPVPGQKVIIDEFHYTTTDPQRARAYIDGIVATSSASKILLMSATFGRPKKTKNYIEKITAKEFELYHTNKRMTKQVFFKEPITLDEIKNALVFVFSLKGAAGIAEELALLRDRISANKERRLNEIAELLTIKRIPAVVYKGVGIYTGSLLPKEKLFMEAAFRERIIDVMVGTDALSLGVNLPAETVVFAQLAKYYDGPISKNEFLQMAGRAGRKGYFDTGYVTYYPSNYESFDYDTEELYEYLLAAPQEPMRIELDVSVPALLKGRSIEEEAEYVAQYSYPPQQKQKVIDYIKEILFKIDTFAEERNLPGLKETLADIYFVEYNLGTNLRLAATFAKTEEKLEVEKLISIVFTHEPIRNEFYGFLQLRKYINSLPKEYRKKIANRQNLERMINETDPTVKGFEEILAKIKPAR